jgi:hypothetical protein
LIIIVNTIIKHTTNERRTMTTKFCPPAPPSTPFPEDTSEYHGWYSEAQQRLRVLHPSQHKFKGKNITGPPYSYWMQRDKKVLVTEVTHTSIPTPRQVANGDIYLGRVDKYWGRSYTRLSANILKTDGSADHSTDTRTATRPAAADLSLDEDMAVFVADRYTPSSTVALVVGVKGTGETRGGSAGVRVGEFQSLHRE